MESCSVMVMTYWYLLARVNFSYWIILCDFAAEKWSLYLIKNALHCKKQSNVSLLSHLYLFILVMLLSTASIERSFTGTSVKKLKTDSI